MGNLTDDATATLIARAVAGEEAALLASSPSITTLTRSATSSPATSTLPTKRSGGLAVTGASLRDADRLRPWLVSVAAGETRQLLRRRRRRTVVELSMADPSAMHGSDPAGRSADLDLANALARLDPDDRAPRTALRRRPELDRALACNGTLSFWHPRAPCAAPRSSPNGAPR
jgi:hypothetical protein